MSFKLFTILYFTFRSLPGDSQINSVKYNNLLDSVFTYGQIVCEKPLKLSLFQEEQISDFLYTARDYEVKIDSITLVQLIRNSKKVDTVNWTNKELPHIILVGSINDKIDLKLIMKNLQLKERKQIKFYKRLINKFNNPDPFKMPNPNRELISYYSRPVFDDAHQFAAIEYRSFPGGFGIMVYQRIGFVWKRLGPISRWCIN